MLRLVIQWPKTKTIHNMLTSSQKEALELLIALLYIMNNL